MNLEGDIIYKAVVALTGGWLLYGKKKDKEKLEQADERITRIEEKHKALVNDVHEIKHDSKDIKSMIRNIELALARNDITPDE